MAEATAPFAHPSVAGPKGRGGTARRATDNHLQNIPSASPNFAHGACLAEFERIVKDCDALSLFRICLQLSEKEGKGQCTLVSGRQCIAEAWFIERRITVSHINVRIIDDDAEC